MTNDAYESLSTRLFLLENSIDELKQAQQHHAALTADLLELFSDAKTAVRFIVLAGKIALWMAKVSAAFGVLWAGIRGLHFLFGGKP